MSQAEGEAGLVMIIMMSMTGGGRDRQSVGEKKIGLRVWSAKGFSPHPLSSATQDEDRMQDA